MIRQRAISPRTIYHSWRVADRFLDHRFGSDKTDLAAMSAGEVISFLHYLPGRKGPYRDKTAATTYASSSNKALSTQPVRTGFAFEACSRWAQCVLLLYHRASRASSLDPASGTCGL